MNATFPRSVGVAAEAAVRAREHPEQLKRLFHRSPVPLVLVDRSRRYVAANRPARLALRLSQAELRRYAVDDLTPPDAQSDMEAAWVRLLDAGCVAGAFEVVGPDGSRLRTRYCAVANVTPGVHLVAFAPAGWPEEELGPVDVDGSTRSS